MGYVMPKTLLPSLIRTIVPIIVGALASIPIFRASDNVALSELVTALVTIAYYIIVRALEHYVTGSFGWLLGYPVAPAYLTDEQIKNASLVTAKSGDSK